MQLLEEALGTRAKVGILRALATGPGRAASGHELARALGMSPNTVHRALHELAEAGFVTIEAGRNAHDVRLAEGHALVEAFSILFARERELRSRLIQALRRALPNDVAALLFGSIARGEKSHADIDLLVVAPTHEQAVEAALVARTAARRVLPTPLNAIHLTPAELRRFRGEPWLRAALEDGIRLTPLAPEDVA